MLQLVPSENRAHSVNRVEATSTASPRTRTHKAPAARPSKWLRPTIARPAHTTTTPIRPLSLAVRRFVFWASIPLAVILGGVIVASVPPSADSEPAQSLNLAGSAAFTVAVMAFVVGSTVITQPAEHTEGGLVMGACAVLAAVFAIIDRRAAAPLLPRQLLGRSTLRQGALGGFLNTATTSSAVT